MRHSDGFSWACVHLGQLHAALAATGFIWVRYSFVITPVNYSLAAVGLFATQAFLSLSYYQVNLFVGASGLTQLARIAKYVHCFTPTMLCAHLLPQPPIL